MIYTSYSQGYNPIIEQNKYWDEGTYLDYIPCFISPIRIEFTDEDTLIEGHYYRIYNSYDLLGEIGMGGDICPPFTADTIPSRQAGLREDTVNKKVYSYLPFVSPSDPDVLIYDFSLNIGDTLVVGNSGSYQVVSDIDTFELLNGEIRKRFWFDPYNTFYIEGIGGINGLFYPIFPTNGGGIARFCVKKDGIDLIGNYCNTNFVGTKEYDHRDPLIYPNPARSKITIHLPAKSNSTIVRIYELQGIEIFSSRFNSQRTTVSIEGFASGLYLCIIETDSSVYQVKLIVL